jgi:cytochrome c peroxidase
MIRSCLALLAASSLVSSALASGTAGTFRDRYIRPATVPAPADNITTPERVELGHMLFFDPRLSSSGAISCATCHNPSFAWGDRLPRGVGHGHVELGRRTPTILNAAFNEVQMWDGRFATLEEQALGPMLSSAEMNNSVEKIVETLSQLSGYTERFAQAYPGEGITGSSISKAIAAYERTVISGEAPFDRWVAGDEAAISQQAKHGFVLFNTKAQCASCHSGWNFTDSSFHDLGLASIDQGRGAVLGIDELNHTFKTPTLRNVDQRAPYMHDGSEATLRDVLELYNLGGRVRRATLSSEIKPLGLTEPEMDALLAFLHTLTSVDDPVRLPTLP